MARPRPPNGDEPSDEELAARWYEGDETAFTTLWKRYESPIYHQLHRSLWGCSPEDIEDLMAEILIRVYLTRERPSSRFNPRRGKFSSWLFRIVMNEKSRFLKWRSRKDHGVSIDELPPGEEGIPGDSNDDVLLRLENAERRQQIRRALAELPYLERRIIELASEGKPLREIARALGVSIPTAYRRYRAAWAHLRALLKQIAEGEDRFAPDGLA